MTISNEEMALAWEQAAGWLSGDCDSCNIREAVNEPQEWRIREHIRKVIIQGLYHRADIVRRNKALGPRRKKP